jgi:hypothetical protein
MANFGNGVWLLESDSGNDDWIDDHAGDPELSDASLFTEGTDSWNIIYAKVERGGVFNADYEKIPGWTAIDVSIEEGADIIKVTGTFQGTSFENTQIKEDTLHEFFRNHSSLSDNSFYFVKRWDTNDYKRFPNEDRTLKKYCHVRFSAVPKTFIDKKVLHFMFTLISMWGS